MLMQRKRLIQPTVSANSKLRFPVGPISLRIGHIYNSYQTQQLTNALPPPAADNSAETLSSPLLPGLNNMRQLVGFPFSNQIPTAGVLISNSNSATRPSCLSLPVFVTTLPVNYLPVDYARIFFLRRK